MKPLRNNPNPLGPARIQQCAAGSSRGRCWRSQAHGCTVAAYLHSGRVHRQVGLVRPGQAAAETGGAGKPDRGHGAAAAAAEDRPGATVRRCGSPKSAGGRRRRTRSSTASSPGSTAASSRSRTGRCRLEQRLRLCWRAPSRPTRVTCGRPTTPRKTSRCWMNPARQAVVDRHPGRQVPCSRGVHGVPRRSDRVADSVGAAAGDLAQGRPG